MQRQLIAGAAGDIETVIDRPQGELLHQPRGLALVAHPHPLYGGSLDNKVAQTLARALMELGYVVLRPNFRGVGQSAGVHDHGEGETEDMLQLLQWALTHLDLPQPAIDTTAEAANPAIPLVLAGFSFGAWIQTRVAQALAQQAVPGLQLQGMVLVGLAAGEVPAGRAYDPAAVPADTLLIHGELDDTVPLANVLAWARPQDLPVTVIPGADHFFHRRLHLIRAVIKRHWLGCHA
jgi:hypothetical protein